MLPTPIRIADSSALEGEHKDKGQRLGGAFISLRNEWFASGLRVVCEWFASGLRNAKDKAARSFLSYRLAKKIRHGKRDHPHRR